MARKLTQGIPVDRLDQEIKELGVRVRVYKSTLCPNMTSLESLDHNINCTICNNNMIDFNCQETVAMFQQQDLKEQFTVQGTFHIDEIMVTFLSGVSLHHYSRVDLLDFEEDFFELIQRQEGTDIDRLKYSACKVLGLFTVDQINGRIDYHFGVDFKLNVNGDIEWIGAHKPADRAIYSIYYEYRPIFRAVKAVHRDRYSQYNLRPQNIKAPKKTVGDTTYVKLPETWILKRDYLVERRDAAKTLLGKNELYDPNE